MSTIYLMGCSQDEKKTNSRVSDHQLFTLLTSDKSGIDFVNEVHDGEDFNVLTYRNFYNGGGVAIGDINKDGLADIFFTANMGPNKLYLNKGNLEFEDITEQSGISGERGWSTGVSMVDINADGFMDIYISNSGDLAGDNKKNEFFINNGDLTFSEKANQYNLDNGGYTTHASFFDYDKDGDLDCYILNNSFKDPSRIDIYSRTREENDELGGDKLMRNDGHTFTDVTSDAGIFSSAIGFGLGVSIGDVDGDLWPDIYISNDFWERDYLYINNGNGTFSEELTDRLSICSVSSMGADIGDINNDGQQDIFTTDMLAADNYRLKAMTQFDPYHLEDIKFRSSYHFQILQNCLQVNRGDGQFQETASLSGISATDWSWGALMFDFDNDGWKDIYVCNGIYHDIMYLDFANYIDDKDFVKKIVTEKGRYDFRDFVEYLPTNPIDNYAFVNQRDLTFANKAEDLGFKKGEFSNGAAYGDLDNDGDLDLVINNVNMPASVYLNNAEKSSNHYLSIKLEDLNSQNSDAIGTKVVAYYNNSQVVQEHYMNRGFQSSVNKGLIFGFENGNSINKIEITWPDQIVQTINNPIIDTVLVVSKSSSWSSAAQSIKSRDREVVQSLNDISDQIISGNTKHEEDIFNDFDREKLLPRMHSTEGPKIEVADLNQDGLDDFVVLGATNDPDKLFVQSASGKLIYKEIEAFEKDRAFESTCAAFIDADGDGDQDLVIGSGGNDLSKGMDGFLLRYYENDGSGNFVKNVPKTPPGGGQFSVITPGDFDQDGDMDLFVGGRSIPGNYGLVPRSFLFENVNGTWKDITTEDFGPIGMVTDAIWTDLNNDQSLDLLVVGEWMPVTAFIRDKGSFRKQIIENSNGWWLTVEETDLDQDGKSEYILGNWGHNSKFEASPTEPLSMFVKDFDNNGKTEFVLNWFPPLDTKPFPFASKMDLSEQLPSLKKKFLKYEDFAQQDYNSLFTKNERKGAIEYTCHTLSSSILSISESGLKLKALPNEAQISPLFSIQELDIDADGKMDLWLGGNFYGLKPEVGRLDASKGIIMKNVGRGETGKSTFLPTTISGEIRDSKLIKVKGKDVLLVARNNQTLKALSF